MRVIAKIDLVHNKLTWVFSMVGLSRNMFSGQLRLWLGVSGGARIFFLGGLGPFPLPSLSSLPSLSPPLPFPSLPLLFPFLPFPSPQNEEADRSSAPPSPPVPLEVGPLNLARVWRQWRIQGGRGAMPPPKPNQDNFFAECTRNAIMSLKWNFFSSAQPLQTIRTAKYNQF